MLARLARKIIGTNRSGTRAKAAVSQTVSAAPVTPVSSPSEAKSVPDPLTQRILDDDGSVQTDAPDFVAKRSLADQSYYFEAMRKHFTALTEKGETADEVLKKVTFSEGVETSKVVHCLQQYGIAIFPNLYDADRLAAVKAEFDDLIENGSEFTTKIDAREETIANSYALRLRRDEVPTDRFAELHALFGSPILDHICREFFAGLTFQFNEDLYAQTTGPTEVPASGVLHWDKQLTLKSWLYVSSGEADHGPMRAAARSNSWLRYMREDAMHYGLPYSAIDNTVPEEGQIIVPSGGPAGTFFLFVTDTAHGASPVAEGCERRIIRAQARPTRIAQWAAWAQKRR